MKVTATMSSLLRRSALRSSASLTRSDVSQLVALIANSGFERVGHSAGRGVPKVRHAHGLKRWGGMLLVWAAAAACLAGAATSEAQTVSLGGTRQVGSGFSGPYGAVVDSKGDVFVANGGGNAIQEIVAVNGVVSSTSSVSTVGSGFNYPTGLALDASGDVFVADYENHAVKEIVAVNGTVSASSTVLTVGSGFLEPCGVAVDSSGDVFVADEGQHLLKKIVAVNGSVSSSSSVITISTTGVGNAFIGVAVDAKNDVFTAGETSGLVQEFVAVSGVVGAGATPVTVGGGFSEPTGVAVDGSGDVFVADIIGKIDKIVAVNGTVSSTSSVTTVSSGLSEPVSLALDSNVDVYAVSLGTNTVTEIQSNGPFSFSTTAVGSAATQVQITVSFGTGGTIGAPVVLTEGKPSLDFSDAGTGTCTTNGTAHSYVAGATCTINLAFTPKFAGMRSGAVEVSNSSGAIIATALLEGTGTGPQAVVYPGTQTKIGSTLPDTFGIAVDSSNNLYVGDIGDGALVKETLSNGSYVATTVDSNLGFFGNIAVDGAGDVFFASQSQDQVVEEQYNAATSVYTPKALFTAATSGLNQPNGLTVDASGAIYIGNGSQLLKETPGVSGYTQTLVDGTLGNVVGLAVDASGNLYVADAGNSALYKETLAAGTYTRSTIATGLSNANGVTVDAAGTVYVVADGTSNQVLRYAPNGSGGYTAIAPVGSFQRTNGVALAANGNLFVTDDGAGGLVYKIDVADAQTFTFGNTVVNAASAAQTATLTNIGNAALTFKLPTAGTNPTFASSNYTLGNSSTCPSLTTQTATAPTLAAGATCTDIISFTPKQGGTIADSLVTTDNSQNVSTSTQAVSVTGTGLANPVVSSITPASGTISGGTAVTITGSQFTGATAVAFGGVSATNFTVVSDTQITATAPAAAVGAVNVIVTNSVGVSSTSVADQFTYMGPPTLVVTNSAAIAGGTAILTATVSGTTTPTGGVSFSVNGGASVVATCTAGTGSETCTAPYTTAGLKLGSSYTITASFTADANYLATSNTGTVTIVPNSYTAANTPVGSTSSTGTATVVFAATATLSSNSATAIQVVTQGIAGLDFAYASGGTCAAGGTYIAGQSCTVNYTFTPRVPGARYGAVLLATSGSTTAAASPKTVTTAAVATSSNVVAASTLLQGVGTGAQADITPGVISTVAGSGPPCIGTGACGDGGLATAANISQPSGVAIDAAGNTYIADTFAQRIRRIDAGTGVITTIAGTGAIAPSCNGVDGDGGLATGATLSYPQAITIDGAGNLYIADTSDQRIRKITLQTGIISTVAGGVVVGSTCTGSTGDGGPATSASFSSPDGIAIDGAGNLYIAELNGNRIRRIDAVTGSIATVVGTGTASSTGDNGLATAATINGPAQMAFDPAGNLFFTEYTGNRVRELLANGTITTVAGTGTPSSTGDGGSALAATLLHPNGVAVDAADDIYIAEEGSRIRMITASTGVINTVAGTGTAGYTADGVGATQSGLSVPEGVALDGRGNLFIADTNDNRIREVMMTTSGALAFGSAAVGTPSADSPRLVTLFNAGQTSFTVSSDFASSSNQFQVTASTCTVGSTLAGGFACTAEVSFTPTAVGAQTGTVTVVDSTGVTHTFAVSGTGTQATPLIVVADASIAYGTGTASLTAVVTFGANAAPTGQFTFTVGTGASITATCVAATSTTELCTAIYPTAALAASTSGSATYTITGSLVADATYLAASDTATLTVTQAVLLPTVANVSATTAGPASLSVTIPYVGLPSTGAVTFTVGSNAAVAGTCTAGSGVEVCTASYPTTGLALGSNTITVSVAGDSLYGAVTATGTLTVVPSSYVLPATPVATPSQVVTATLVFNGPVTLNATLLTGIQVVTQGAPNLDFAYAPGGTCVAGASFTAGGSCTVNVIFTPTAPGARLGAVLLYDNSATPLLAATAYLGGTGTSGLGLFEPATQTTVGSGLQTARGPSVDALGNLYVSEQASGFGAVDKFAAGTGTKTVLASGLTGPGGTTVDGAGNVFYDVTDDGSGSGGVFELIGGTGTPVEIASGLTPDNVLLSDGAGNVYVTDYNSDAIYEIAAGNHAVTTIFNGFGDRFIGLAMDASGNFYGATFGGNTMYELPVGNYNNPITLFSGNGLSNPHGLAIDPAGNLYVTNYSGQGNVIRYAAGTYAATTLAATGSRGIAIDGAGNLYASDDGDLYAYNRGNAAALSFASTAVGATSGDSPQSLVFENDGNAALAVSGLGTSSSNFTLDATATTCATGAFAVAATCNLGVDFTPVAAGTLTGTLNVTDNNLNLAGTVQTVNLNGIATQGTPTVAIAAATVVYGTPTTALSATLTYPGTTAPTGAFTFTVGSGSPVVAACSAGTGSTETCTASYPTAALTVNSYTVTGSLAADTNDVAASMMGTLAVTQATPILSVAGLTTSFSNTNATLTATLAYTGMLAPTGAVTFSVGGTTVTAACAGTASPLTCTASLPLAGAALGANTINASVAADTNYTAATATGTLNLTAATATVTVSNATAVYGTPTTTLIASVAYTGTTAPTGGFSFTVGSGPAVVASCAGTASPLTCTVAYTTSALAVNSYQVNGSLAGDSRFGAAAGTGTLTVTQALPAVTVSNATVAYGTATTSLSASFTFPGSTAPTGAVTFTIDSGAAITAVCTGTTSPRSCTATSSTATLTAGTHTIKASAAADANFSAASGTGTLTVTSTTPQVTVTGQTIAYGTTNTTLSANVAFSGAIPTGAVSFTIDTGAAGTATCSGTTSPRTCTASYTTATLAVGAHTAKASLAADANYSASSGMGTVTVTSTTPAITVASVSASYGAASATLSASVTFTGAVPTSAVLFTVENGTAVTASCAGTASPLTCTASYPVASLTSGAHTVTATLAADANYGAASGTGTLTLVVTNATISFAVANHSYGDPAFTVAATSNSTGAFTYTVISGPATVSGSTVTLTGIGTVVLQANQAADANFVAGSKQASFTVSAATLTAAASNATRLYGAANPAFTGTVTGGKYADTFAETFTTAATASSPVGTYAIVPAITGADLLDYTATATNGTLTITQAPTVASVTASAATVNPNQAVTFNAAVASTTTGTPTGTVTFFDNGTAL